MASGQRWRRAGGPPWAVGESIHLRQSCLNKAPRLERQHLMQTKSDPIQGRGRDGHGIQDWAYGTGTVDMVRTSMVRLYGGSEVLTQVIGLVRLVG